MRCCACVSSTKKCPIANKDENYDFFNLGSATKTLTVDNPRKLFEVDKMSESYHEIFDTQMPPEAAAQLCENSEAEEATEIGKNCSATKTSKSTADISSFFIQHHCIFIIYPYF